MRKTLKALLVVALLVLTTAVMAGSAFAGKSGFKGGTNGQNDSWGWNKNSDKACASSPFWGCSTP